MSENLTPLIIKDWLANASFQLSEVGIDSHNLDAEIILAHTLNKNRTYLHAHSDDVISIDNCKVANSKLSQRLKRMPIAYIIGHKEFYGRQFNVDNSTLIPRPESEDIITILKSIIKLTQHQIPPIELVDIGTGSGCLGITAKLEFPEINVTLTDINNCALEVVSKNAQKMQANVSILQSDLLQNYNSKPDIIIANLPYVDKSWHCSPETKYEPSTALFADDHGQAMIKKLINQASNKMSSGGYIIIEADKTQHYQLIEYANNYSFSLYRQLDFIIALKYNPETN